MPLPAQRLRFVQAIVKTANASKFVIARPQRGRGNLGKAVAFLTGVPCYPTMPCEIAAPGLTAALLQAKLQNM